jgi:hypothetical protein
LTTSDLAPSTYRTADSHTADSQTTDTHTADSHTADSHTADSADTATSYGGDPAAVATPRVGRHARPTDDAPAFWTEKKEPDEDEDEAESAAPITAWTPPASAVMPPLPVPEPLDQPSPPPPVVLRRVASPQSSGTQESGAQAPAPYDAAPVQYSPRPRYEPPLPNQPYIGPFAPKRRRVNPALAALLVVALLGGAGFGAKTYLDHRSSQPASALSSKPMTSTQLTNYALLPADLPPGWTTAQLASGVSAGATTAGNGAVFSSKVDSELSTCVGVKNTDPHQVGLATSPEFGSGTNTIGSTANSFRSATDVANAVALLTSPKSAACLKAEVEKGLVTASGVALSDVAITTSGRVAGQPSDVAANVAETMVASANGNSLEVSASVVLLANNLTLTEVDFFGIGSPVAADIQQSVIAKLAAKLAR